MWGGAAKRSALWGVRVMWFEDVEAEGFCCCEVGFAVFDFGSSVDSDSVDESSSVILAFEEFFDGF